MTTLTAQSGPSAKRLAAARYALNAAQMQWRHDISDRDNARAVDDAIEELEAAAIAADQEATPAGARDAVADALEALAVRFDKRDQWMRTKTAPNIGLADAFKDAAADIRALTGKADGDVGSITSAELKRRMESGEKYTTRDYVVNPEATQPAATGAGEVKNFVRDWTRVIKTMGKPTEETNTAATGMGDANLRALSNLAAPGLFEHDAEHASVIGGGAAPGCDGDKCVHHTIVIEDADLQFMVAAANHVRTALAAPVSAGGLRDAVKLIANECDGIEGLGSAVIAQRLRAALAAQPATVVEPTDEAIEEFLSSRITPEGRVPMIQTIKDALATFVCMDCRYNGCSLCDTHGTAQPAPVVGGPALWWNGVDREDIATGPSVSVQRSDWHTIPLYEHPVEPVVGGDDDWVLAPKDPTEEMIQRGLLLGDTPNHVTIVYQSMLAAAPKPTALLAARPGGEGEVDRALLVSMALRLNHGFGLDTPAQQERQILNMQQVWEEVAGKGFYSQQTRERYLAMDPEAHPAQAGGEVGNG